jgi:hypoxanthine phosphoribosyltransferase
MHPSSHIYSPDVISVFDKHFKKMLSEDVIFDRVQALGKLITADYKGKKPIFLIVLNGSFIFAADLIRACHLECETAFIQLSSYTGMHSTGKVKTVMDFTIAVSGREVIIVEDIIDTGKTMHHFLHTLAALRPTSIAIATLLLKPEAIQYKVPVHYCGFEIENKFVIGYGLDFNEVGRNLAAIYQLDV